MYVTNFLLFSAQRVLLILAFTSACVCFTANAETYSLTVSRPVMLRQATMTQISGAKRINDTCVEVYLSNGRKYIIDFYGANIFRLFQDPGKGTLRDPEANPPAKILADDARRPAGAISIDDAAGRISVRTAKVIIDFDKQSGLFTLTDRIRDKVVVKELVLPVFTSSRVALNLQQHSDEYFYGGGVQNGRFSHKGKLIAIENQNSWTDGGVASPCPFYWSTRGYGLMFYTFKKGKYDFGAQVPGEVKLSHEMPYLDVFFMLDEKPESLLADFYQLTGNPVLLPKFAFYEGHLNAYNRDFWKEDPKGILFEDNKRYTESQKDNGGVKESLNGEKNNYQFSARAVIDRYRKHDMPLGWILPNDGYGAGYGQTETLDGNIANLKSFGDYARKNGVEIGLWTQSDLHPKDSVSALLQRDIVKEVGVAGVRVLKTDVAWVGAGYSFGLNGVADVGTIMPRQGNNARPFIISLDGWAGTQRYAGVWSGDQTGGEWEYIRFHIPTFIGSGLSGQPNITSDMDGIFGGKNLPVNVREFQWKTFTPMQLNMDGWGTNEKYPHALGEPATSINRMYLKLKSALMPYAYSIAYQSVSGLPMIRPMFVEESNAYTLSAATQYQFMYGPSFLVAPVYKNTRADNNGNDIRNSVYLPQGSWIDYFTGQRYKGGRIINNVDAPIWKLPVFVRSASIIPMVAPNNNVRSINRSLRIYEIYADGKASFTEYDDDGVTEAYRKGSGSSTLISTDEKDGKLLITVAPSTGSFDNMVREKSTAFVINVSEKPDRLAASLAGKRLHLTEVKSLAEYEQGSNVFYYNARPQLNSFATPGTEFEKVQIVKNPQLMVKIGTTDIYRHAIRLEVSGFVFNTPDRLAKHQGRLGAPRAAVQQKDVSAFSLSPSWSRMANADYYEIDFNGEIYSTITDSTLLFDELQPATKYSFKLRSVNSTGKSDWVSFSATTSADPLRYAVRGIRATSSVDDEEGYGIEQLVNLNATDMWHTKWDRKAVPFEIVLDLRSINQLDKLHYLPRKTGANGLWIKGSVSYSMDKTSWMNAGDFTWTRDSSVKTLVFNRHPTARFVKVRVTEAVGNYGTGRELMVFKVAGSVSFVPGDINNDKKIDANDLTSYMNYTGLRAGDSDFEGYISAGDINKNGLIDAYDISTVSTQLEDGVSPDKVAPLSGKVIVDIPAKTIAAGEDLLIAVKGAGLKSVNALSFALPYNARDLEFVSIVAQNMKDMQNFTYDRLHANGVKSLYPTFINVGNKDALDGSADLFMIKFKARRNMTFKGKVTDGILVDKNLNTLAF